MRTHEVVILLAIGLAIGSGPAVGQVTYAQSPPSAAEIVATGSARTQIGRVSWTAVKGDATRLPFGKVFATPDGFAAFELPCCAGQGSRFWTSTDGLDWSVAPMPVPTDGWVWHSVAGGEHWILAPEEFRLWHSSDLVSWSEVDMRAVRPSAIPGIRWTTWPTGLAAVRSTAVLPWDGVRGHLALDDLLGIDLGPDEGLAVGTVWDEPTFGEDRPVWLRQDVSDGISSEDPKEQVGTIRVVVDGSIVRVIDATRDAELATIDAAAVGLPAKVIAEGLNHLGQFDVPEKGILVEGDVARPFDGPSGIRILEPVGDRLVALAGEAGADPVVWATKDGVDWELLGPPIVPPTTAEWSEVDRFDLFDRPSRTPNDPLKAVVDVDGQRARARQELWTSVDGHGWVRTSVMANRPRSDPGSLESFSRGYLGIGDDFRAHVSVDGRRWSHVRHLRGIGRSVDRSGGAYSTSVLSDELFHLEDPYGPNRVLWKLTIDPDR